MDILFGRTPCIVSITSTNNIKKIKETYDKIETNARNRHFLDVDASQYGPVLISTVMSKLLEDIKLKISQSMSISREWDVDELLAALLKEIGSREICSFMHYLRKDNKYRGSRKPDSFTGPPGLQFTIKCTYCQKDHKITNVI